MSVTPKDYGDGVRFQLGLNKSSRPYVCMYTLPGAHTYIRAYVCAYICTSVRFIWNMFICNICARKYVLIPELHWITSPILCAM